MDRPLRAIIVDNIFPIDRLEINNGFTFDEIMGIANEGVQVHVISRQNYREGKLNGIFAWGIQQRLSKSERIAGFGLGVLGYATRRNSFRTVFEDSLVVEKFRKLIQSTIVDQSIDIIHAQWPYPQGVAAAKACQATGKPLIISTRGGDLNVVADIGHGLRLDKRKDSMIREALSVANHVIVPSKFMEDQALESGVRKEKIARIPNGVDPRKFHPEVDGSLVRNGYGLKKRPIILSLVNGLGRRVKGIEYLLKAIPEVKKVYNDLMLVIGGGGLTSSLVNITQELSIKENVLFVGPVPRIQAPLYYAAADVVAIPSLAEAQCMVSIEAMAMSKPIVASNVGGLPESLGNGSAGLLVPARDPAELAIGIIEVLKNREVGRKLGKAGKEIVLKHYNSQEQFPKIIALYKQVS